MEITREFRSICYEVARRTGGRVAEFRVAQYARNFHQGVIDYGDYCLSVVCTLELPSPPLISVAVPPGMNEEADVPDTMKFSGAGVLTFVDAPEIIAVLAEYPGYQVLTAADLAGPFDIKLWPDYHPIDMGYVLKYMRDPTLGEVLFGDFD